MTIQTRNPNPPRTGATTVYLSAEDIELARTLGGGNASAGVRLALARYRATERELDTASKPVNAD